MVAGFPAVPCCSGVSFLSSPWVSDGFLGCPLSPVLGFSPFTSLWVRGLCWGVVGLGPVGFVYAPWATTETVQVPRQESPRSLGTALFLFLALSWPEFCHCICPLWDRGAYAGTVGPLLHPFFRTAWLPPWRLSAFYLSLHFLFHGSFLFPGFFDGSVSLAVPTAGSQTLPSFFLAGCLHFLSFLVCFFPKLNFLLFVAILQEILYRVPLLVGELGFLEVRCALDFCWGVEGQAFSSWLFLMPFVLNILGQKWHLKLLPWFTFVLCLLCALSPWNTFLQIEHGISCSGRRVLDGVAFFSASLLGSLQSVPSSKVFSVSVRRGAWWICCSVSTFCGTIPLRSFWPLWVWSLGPDSGFLSASLPAFPFFLSF